MAETDGGFAIHLDGRPVRTPAKTPLIVPTQPLAQAIAQEWDAQNDEIDPLSMPMTRSANAALDKVSAQRTEVATMIAAYGESDLLCYRADSPESLVKRQAAAWDPMLDWAAQELNARLICAAGVMHVAQPERAVAALNAHVQDQDAFALTALHDLVALSGSLVIGLAAQRRAFDLPHLWAISRIDENWQTEQWGSDEDAEKEARIKRSAFEHAAKFWSYYNES